MTNIFQSAWAKVQAFESGHSGRNKYPDGYSRVDSLLQANAFKDVENSLIAYALWELAKKPAEDADKLQQAWRDGYHTPNARPNVRQKKASIDETMPVSAISFFLNRKESIYKKAMPELPEDSAFIADILKGVYDSVLSNEQMLVKAELPREMEARKKAETLAKKLEKNGYAIKHISVNTIVVVIPPTMADHIAKFGNGEYSPNDNGFIVNVAVE